MSAANSMTLGGRVLNISFYIFNGHMKNKGKFTPKTTKKDAGILGSEASNYIVSSSSTQVSRSSEGHIQTSEHKG